jgi:hypothetical protein
MTSLSKTVVVGDTTYTVLQHYDLASTSGDEQPKCVLIDSSVVETMMDLIDFYYRTSSGPVTASFSDQNAIFVEGKPTLRVVFPPGTMDTLYQELSVFHVTVGDEGGDPYLTLISDDEGTPEGAVLTLAYSDDTDLVSDETAQEWVNARMKTWRADAGAV